MLRIVVGGRAVRARPRKCCVFVVLSESRGSCRSRTNKNVEYVFGRNQLVSDEPLVGVRVAASRWLVLST
jgi:hypothetical protein